MINELKTFKNTFSYKIIYIFTIIDEPHSGCVKVGDTTLDTDLTTDRLQPNCHELNEAARRRIEQYTKTAAVEVQLMHTELAIRQIQKKDFWQTESFRDYDVHRVLIKSGIKRKEFGNKKFGNEWFECDYETAIKAITAVKHGDEAIDTLIPMEKFIPINFRPEQKDAINKTIKQFKKSPRMLWNAKMRFGKTLSALEVVRQMDFKKTVLITHRPVVDDGWHDDFKKIFTKEDKFRYGSKKSGIEIKDLERTFEKEHKNYIYFASIQDLRGSKIVGGKFDKNDDVFNIEWDCVIIDEAHEGTTTELGDKVKSILFKPEKGTKLLELSGTPFNILSNYEDDDNSVFTWDYVMEQRAKKEWEETHFGDSNPYSDLPEMKMYTYNLGKLINAEFVDVEDKAFNFAEFFRTNEQGNFVHEKNINAFLNLLTKKDDNSLYPFSRQEYIELFHHTLWMVPGVKEALAFQHLLENHPVFGTFKIVNVAGDGDPEDPTGEALQAVRTAIENAGDTGYTITLSCGKLTTGVSVKQWTAVFMLYGTYSTKAAGYLQTIFRVQTPCNDYGKSKTTAYVFDFAPDRTLKMVSDAVSLSAKAGKTTLDAKVALGEFLNFCPVIGIDGSSMKHYEVAGLLQQLKRAYAERAVTKGFDDTSLYNDELLKLTDVEIQKFNSLQKIIGKTKANEKLEKIPINLQGLTNEEYKKLSDGKPEPRILSPEEEEQRRKIQEAKKLRQTAISILRGISVRMPLLIYGADVPVEEDISLNRFVELVDEDSWKEFMPSGVTKEKFLGFTKYYDEDVFIAAGKRIRQMVLQADTLSITERVKKIAEIFSYFKNPDKETVLTPWRVVNMHISDCLGGFNFYDSNFTKALTDGEEPHFVDVTDVTENTLANPNAKILEINSKTGLYPLYCAYSIFRAKRNQSMKDETALWFKTIDENIFVICKTKMARFITLRTLCGFRNTKVNTYCFDDLINQFKNKQEHVIEKILKEKTWNKGTGKMKFDAIVGNPPYQEMDGGAQASASPVYNLFVEGAKKIKPNFISLIMPARWFSGGKGLDKFRDNMLKDKNIQTIHDFPNGSDCFPTVEIKGGVMYFLWNKNKTGDCIVCTHKGYEIISQTERPLLENGCDVFIRHNELIPIFRKINGQMGNSFMELVSQMKPFGIRGDFFKSPAKYNLPPISDKKINGGYTIYGLDEKQKRVLRYIPKDYPLPRKDNLNKYKMFMSRNQGSGILGEIFSTPIFAKPNELCTETFITIGPFKNENEMFNAWKYICTKFFRTLVGIKKLDQGASRSIYQFVPLQDFTENSDIDWSETIPNIDKQLYKKYKLEKNEIDFIETMIKPME